ncbi:phospholipase A1-Igamma2, chloroplastic-like [Vigna unguiculata]|uniref:Phospholipase A1 n=1 Tax=Vigna unguiculata TaxID=3917 RepID=A0A4D6MCA1_VIGUN|nr:phospholipase A1-Igamma2, chloroplastic-like [Vigna unguiculata]QCD97696.1 phospholipase A1 [Vigna unguiculata]
MASSMATMVVPFPQTQKNQARTFLSQPPTTVKKLKPKDTKASKTHTTNIKCSATLSSTVQSIEKEEGKKQKAVAEVWRKIHGEDNWAGLLEPLDPLMRTELIRYGEMAQACYDAFDYDPYSKYCGSCKYSIPEFFQSLDMPNAGYNVTRYLYATANINLPKFFRKSRWADKTWSQHANWSGFIAVSDDATSKRLGRRDITIAWRGTVTNMEWVADLTNYLRPVAPFIPSPDEGVKVEAGFLDLYTDKEQECGYCKYSAREQVLGEVKRLMAIYSDEEVSITITGHSLGSAMAILSAYDITESGASVGKSGRKAHVSVFSFSGPRVGNARFKDRLEGELGVKVLRVLNKHDLVPQSPGLVFNEGLPPWVVKLVHWLPWCYLHVGEEVELDHKKSPFLNPNGDPACAHNLEAMMHLLDGYHSKYDPFKRTSERDVALVNKACDFLKDEYKVPPNWRQELNKNMIKTEGGRWVFTEREVCQDPHHEDIDPHLGELGLFSFDKSTNQ